MIESIFQESEPEFLARKDGIKIACRYQTGDGSHTKPTLVFLPGYMSDMQGGKAQALAAWAKESGHPMLRLDYSGCGESDGDFADGTLSIWRDDILMAIGHYTNGPIILIGSSMGGWLMLPVALSIGPRLTGLIGIAAAPDFTEWGITDEQKAQLMADEVIYEENPYGPEPTPTYPKFYKDSIQHIQMQDEIAIDCPVRLFQGQCDDEVPWEISTKLAAKLRSDDVQIKLIKDGDHRFSRPQDIEMLIDSAAELCTK